MKYEYHLHIFDIVIVTVAYCCNCTIAINYNDLYKSLYLEEFRFQFPQNSYTVLGDIKMDFGYN